MPPPTDRTLVERIGAEVRCGGAAPVGNVGAVEKALSRMATAHGHAMTGQPRQPTDRTHAPRVPRRTTQA